MALWRKRLCEQRDYSHLSQTPAPEVLEKAITACSFKGGPRWEHYVNRDLLALFGEVQTVSIGDVVERYLDMLAATRNTKREKPTAFNHSRAGNLVGWGLRLGLLEEVLDEADGRGWRLVDRALRWDVHDGKARHIRGLPAGEQAVMDRKLATQRKRAETFAKKHAMKIAPLIKRNLDEFLRDEPDALLGEKFGEFVQPWFTPPVALHQAYGVLIEAHHGWPKDKQERWRVAIGREAFAAHCRAMELDRTPRSGPEAMTDEDAAALDDLI